VSDDDWKFSSAAYAGIITVNETISTSAVKK
jgi:hypothetical protein